MVLTGVLLSADCRAASYCPSLTKDQICSLSNQKSRSVKIGRKSQDALRSFCQTKDGGSLKIDAEKRSGFSYAECSYILPSSWQKEIPGLEGSEPSAVDVLKVKTALPSSTHAPLACPRLTYDSFKKLLLKNPVEADGRNWWNSQPFKAAGPSSFQRRTSPRGSQRHLDAFSLKLYKECRYKLKDSLVKLGYLLGPQDER